MNDDSGDEQPADGDDYYAFLNIPREADEDVIHNAYRRFSRIYHPDKHLEPDRKREAELLFGKTKKAYEVLINPHSRAIYDSLGTAGLETQGWEIVQRTKTPQEIREEYERLAREREERRLLQRTNPKSSIKMNINATELFSTYDEDTNFDFRDLFGLPHIEISGMSISQSIDAPLTTKDTAVMAGNLNISNGTGHGNLNCCFRRVTSEKGWGELEVGAGDGLNLSIKGFRNFSRGFFGNVSATTVLAPHNASFGTAATLANQLDKNTVGYLTWKTGGQSGMTTMIIRDTETAHLVASLYIGIPHTYCSLSYTHKMTERDAKLKLTGKAGTFGAILEYGAEKKVSQHSTVTAMVAVGVPTGVHLRLRLKRSSQNYSTSIFLCEEILPAPIIYGTLIPIITWAALQKLIIQPYIKRQKETENRKQREANKTRLFEKRQEAASAVVLMKETVKRIIEQEESKKGLVILQAIYGRLITDEYDGSDEESDVVDATIPLQCLVKDSKLLLQDASKSSLPGLFDPCPGEEKFLRVKYIFHAVNHQVTIKDDEILRIPKQSHRTDK